MTQGARNHRIVIDLLAALGDGRISATHVAQRAGYLPGIGAVIVVNAQRDDGYTTQVIKQDYPHHSYGHYNLTAEQARDQWWAIVNQFEEVTRIPSQHTHTLSV